jgi:ABC-type antimicrobial peptide transport system permease subunit
VLLLSAFGFLGLLLAAVGLFGVVSYLVAERTREFGVRMALGAERRDVYRQVLRGAAEISIVGCAFGLFVSMLASRALEASLFNVSRFDAMTMLVAPLLLFSVALLAAYFPARRAAKVDPMVALRYE